MQVAKMPENITPTDLYVDTNKQMNDNNLKTELAKNQSEFVFL